MNLETFEKEYNKLNDSQKKAVDTIYWPVMVVAGPWTWKTQIIWLRTANIIQKAKVNPNNILITTFTDAWVIAIKKRLEYFLWSEWHKVVVSTIHSFCQDVIRNFPELFLQYKAWTPIDDVDWLEILKKIIDDLVSKKVVITLTNDYDKYLYLRDIKSRISTLKQEWISFNAFEKIIQNQKISFEEELANIKPTLKKYEKTKQDQEKQIAKLTELNLIYEQFNKYLNQNSLYDFNDMINFVLDAFEKNNDLKIHYAEKFQFIMLDEYQDTNNAQNKIIDLILSVSSPLSTETLWKWNEFWWQNILVVWDDDQSIYRFQWANIENMLDFVFKFEEITTVVLENNYRSTQNILDLCTSLIENNNERLSKRVKNIEKKLISSNPKYKDIFIKPTLFTPNTQELENSYLLNEVKKALENGIPHSEIAIIVRNNKEVESLSQFFIENKIPVTSKLNTDILKNEYVIFILKFLHCLNETNYKENYFIDILRNSILWLNQVDIFKFNKDLYNLNYTKKVKLAVFDKFIDIENSEVLYKEKENLIEFKDKFLDLKTKLSELNFMEFFKYFIDSLKIVEYIEKNWSFSDIEDIYTLFNKIKSFFELDNTFTLEKFLSKIDLYNAYNYSISRQILKTPVSWINILTAHSSKWLEYDIVFVPWLYNWNWDNKKVIDKLKLPNWIAWKWLQTEVDPIEEERRLFFVACSRAKKQLFLSFPLSIQNKIKLSSSFLKEIEWYFENYIFEEQDLQSALESSIKNSLKTSLLNYSDEEFDYIKEFLESYKLSPTDLNVFLEDPLEFLKNVVFKYPFLDNDATIFWKVYHRVLELFYLKYKEKWILENVSYLTSTFKLLLDREVLTPESYEKLLEKWTQWLKGFYELYKNNNRKILHLEYNFRPKWLNFKWIPITWKIDKIEEISSPLTPLLEERGNSPSPLGEGVGGWGQQLAFFKESIAIVDYKTWRPKSIWEIKWIDKDWNKKPWEWKYFRQLMFYKLLCELDNEFNSKYEIWSLALDFVEWRDSEYKYIEVPYSSEDYEYFLQELLSSREQISNIDFWKEKLKN